MSIRQVTIINRQRAISIRQRCMSIRQIDMSIRQIDMSIKRRYNIIKRRHILIKRIGTFIKRVHTCVKRIGTFINRSPSFKMFCPFPKQNSALTNTVKCVKIKGRKEIKKMDANKIEELMKNAWEELCKTFDDKASKYSKLLPDIKEAKEAHWLFWNESDMMVRLARLFYEQLADNGSDIQMHFDKNLNPQNFHKYDFENDLKKLQEKLKEDKRRCPRVDLIITPEVNYGPFLMCAEAKYFHYSVGNPIEAITKNIKTLLEIKDFGIAKKLAFIFFDDYYYLEEPDKSKEICDMLKEIEAKNEILVLCHNSYKKVKVFITEDSE